MNTTLEAFEFIDSKTVKDHVIQEYKADRFIPTIEDLITLVWNSNMMIYASQNSHMNIRMKFIVL